MKSVIIIPARYASTRFPGKPLADLGGKSVIEHVVEKASRVSEYVFVATDDERIYNKVKSFGGKPIITSVNHASGTDRCLETYKKITAQENFSFDVIVNVQGDEPFIHPQQITQLIESFKNLDTQIATLAKQIKYTEDIFDSNKVKVVFSSQMKALYFSRSAIPFCRGEEKNNWLEKTDFYKHLGIYAYRPAVLEEITSLPLGKLEQVESLEQLRWLENGYHIQVGLTEHESIGIDTPEDLELAKKYI
ncbi:MAG: 3-deoxy-manno-octulosonate cytidylyltransferase [Odoribacter sp.]|nr:3-deoxy-manno-octulosonate cytidylyltransferase [Odoribacter sp.]